MLKNSKIIDHDYKIRDTVMLTNNYAYKYETPYDGPFGITQCWRKGTIKLQYGAKNIRHNVRHINPYTSDTNVEDNNNENMYEYSQHMITSYILLYSIKFWKKSE